MASTPLRGIALVLLTLGAIGPSVLAHSDGVETTYDPLVLSAKLFLTPDGALRERGPAVASAYFAASDPAQRAKAMNFTFTAPLAFQLGHGLDVSLQIIADKPVAPAQDADGNAIQFAIYQNGVLLNESVKKVPLGKPALAPGDAVVVHALLQVPSATFRKGDNVTLSFLLTLPIVTDSALKVAFGPSGSAAMLDSMRIPSVQDLELEDGPLQVFDPRATAFHPADANSVVYTGIITHDRIDLPDLAETQGRSVFLVLRGDEPPADAHKWHDALTRDARVAAAHSFLVGTTLVRVHPGVAVVVPLGAGPATVVVTCATHCPAPGFRSTITFTGRANATTAASGPALVDGAASALIPPPPATDGIPVSKDAPAAKQTPNASLATMLACSLVAGLLTRRK